MATGQRERRSAAGECRRCQSFCDKLVDPRACMEMGCRYLYSYEDRPTGRRFMGCMFRVFGAEIDIDDFLLAEAGPGYGGIKMTGRPLPQCEFSVEQAYEGTGPAYECTNRRFFDCDDSGSEGIRAFDLRNALR